MKRYTLLLSLLVTFALATTLSAQSLAGISVEAKSVPIIVYIDNTRVCNPTYSCYVALPRGNYRVRVEVPLEQVHARKRVIYDRNFYFSGYGTEYIDAERYLSLDYGPPGDRDDYDRPRRDYSSVTNSKGFRLRPLPRQTYKALLEELEDCSFKSDVEKVMTLYPADAGVTAQQFKALCSVPSFDSSKLVVARALVSQVLDIENCTKLGDVFSFSSSENEVRDLLRKELDFRYGYNKGW